MYQNVLRKIGCLSTGFRSRLVRRDVWWAELKDHPCPWRTFIIHADFLRVKEFEETRLLSASLKETSSTFHSDQDDNAVDLCPAQMQDEITLLLGHCDEMV